MVSLSPASSHAALAITSCNLQLSLKPVNRLTSRKKSTFSPKKFSLLANSSLPPTNVRACQDLVVKDYGVKGVVIRQCRTKRILFPRFPFTRWARLGSYNYAASSPSLVLISPVNPANNLFFAGEEKSFHISLPVVQRNILRTIRTP